MMDSEDFCYEFFRSLFSINCAYEISTQLKKKSGFFFLTSWNNFLMVILFTALLGKVLARHSHFLIIDGSYSHRTLFGKLWRKSLQAIFYVFGLTASWELLLANADLSSCGPSGIFCFLDLQLTPGFFLLTWLAPLISHYYFKVE